MALWVSSNISGLHRNTAEIWIFWYQDMNKLENNQRSKLEITILIGKSSWVSSVFMDYLYHSYVKQPEGKPPSNHHL